MVILIIATLPSPTCGISNVALNTAKKKLAKFVEYTMIYITIQPENAKLWFLIYVAQPYCLWLVIHL